MGAGGVSRAPHGSGKKITCGGKLLACPGCYADGGDYIACEEHARWHNALNPFSGVEFTKEVKP